MKLTDFPPNDCLTLIQSILYRYHLAKERWPPGRGIITETYLSIEEARLIFASGKWLQRYNDWKIESDKAKGKIGVFPAEFALSVCAEFMTELAEKIDKDDPRIVLRDKDMRMLKSVLQHLDHYDLPLAIKDKPRGNWKKR